MPIQYINDIAPGLPVSDAEKLKKLDNVGVVCVIMKLKEALTSNFWLNVTDERMDIPGMIELSNLNTGLPDNILYIPFYMHKDHPKYSEPSENFVNKATEYVRLVNPDMTADKILDIRVFRYEYAQPVATLGFLSKLPAIASDERKGFFFADTAFCYPEDRSINESVKMAYGIVDLIRNSEFGIRN
jgi:protoporphyrinogen oxidase